MQRGRQKKVIEREAKNQMLLQTIRFCGTFLLALACFAQRPGQFTVLGPGGGGAMFNPAISPHDPNTVLVSCDMTGSYITHDGGQSWRMFNLRGTVSFFAFDPKESADYLRTSDRSVAHPGWRTDVETRVPEAVLCKRHSDEFRSCRRNDSCRSRSFRAQSPHWRLTLIPHARCMPLHPKDL